MAFIVFYDTTELDKQQLTAALKPTDHYWEFVDSKVSLDNLNPETEILSVFTMSSVTREIIERLPKLTLICCRSTGFNNIDLKAANEHNVTVVNVPRYGDTTVAEYTFTLLLALTRRLPEVLETEYEAFKHSELTGTDLSHKTFGVVGAGKIGQKVLKVAHGFSMHTLAYDQMARPELAAELHFEYVGLDELLTRSDVVSLHVPYIPETHHLLNRERIFSMKPGAILINTSRGALVDSRALIDALTSGHLRGAVLDVMEGEDLLKFEEETALLREKHLSEAALRHSLEISVLKKMPNVIVSPHNAFNTVEAIGRINQTTADNIIGYYNQDIPNRVQFVPRPLGKLILVRHTESVWNASGVWSGLTDIPLSEKGQQDSKQMGEFLKGLNIPITTACYTEQTRTKRTLDGILEALSVEEIEVLCEPGFNERNYGMYTGMDKWKVKEEIGEAEFERIRRGWDVPFPNGETLKDVYARVVPAYQHTILPRLRQGKNVLVVAHGNSLRALMKYLDSIPDESVDDLEMLMNQVVVYEISQDTGLKKSVEIKETGIPVEAKF